MGLTVNYNVYLAYNPKWMMNYTVMDSMTICQISKSPYFERVAWSQDLFNEEMIHIMDIQDHNFLSNSFVDKIHNLGLNLFAELRAKKN